VRRILRVAVLGLVALFAVVSGGSMAQAAPADFLIVNGHARLVNVNSGKCLGISAAGQAQGTFAVQWTCQGGLGSDQHMFIQQVASGSPWHTIRPQHTNQCLAVSAASTAAGTSLIQWRCAGGTEQQFAFQETPTGVEILIRHSDQRVAVSAGHTGNGGRIVQWPANSGNEQRWLFQPY
jgi:hypothetical protein